MRAAWGQDRLLAGLRDLEVQLRRDVLVASQNAPPAAESYTPPEDLGIDSFREHLEPLPRLCARLMLDFYSGTDSDLVALRREQVGENEGTSALPSPTCFSFWAGGEFPKPDAPWWQHVQKHMTPGVWVLRERRLRRVHPRSLVVGDLVVLVAGDRALADLRILIARSAEAESEELTGLPGVKHLSPTPTHNSPLYSTNALLTGCAMLRGAVACVVLRPGQHSPAHSLVEPEAGAFSTRHLRSGESMPRIRASRLRKAFEKLCRAGVAPRRVPSLLRAQQADILVIRIASAVQLGGGAVEAIARLASSGRPILLVLASNIDAWAIPTPLLASTARLVSGAEEEEERSPFGPCLAMDFAGEDELALGDEEDLGDEAKEREPSPAAAAAAAAPPPPEEKGAGEVGSGFTASDEEAAAQCGEAKGPDGGEGKTAEGGEAKTTAAKQTPSSDHAVHSGGGASGGGASGSGSGGAATGMSAGGASQRGAGASGCVAHFHSSSTEDEVPGMEAVEKLVHMLLRVTAGKPRRAGRPGQLSHARSVAEREAKAKEERGDALPSARSAHVAQSPGGYSRGSATHSAFSSHGSGSGSGSNFSGGGSPPGSALAAGSFVVSWQDRIALVRAPQGMVRHILNAAKRACVRRRESVNVLGASAGSAVESGARVIYVDLSSTAPAPPPGHTPSTGAEYIDTASMRSDLCDQLRDMAREEGDLALRSVFAAAAETPGSAEAELDVEVMGQAVDAGDVAVVTCTAPQYVVRRADAVLIPQFGDGAARGEAEAPGVDAEWEDLPLPSTAPWLCNFATGVRILDGIVQGKKSGRWLSRTASDESGSSEREKSADCSVV